MRHIKFAFITLTLLGLTACAGTNHLESRAPAAAVRGAWTKCEISTAKVRSYNEEKNSYDAQELAHKSLLIPKNYETGRLQELERKAREQLGDYSFTIAQSYYGELWIKVDRGSFQAQTESKQVPARLELFDTENKTVARIVCEKD